MREDPIASAARKATTLWLASVRLQRALGADGGTSTPKAQKRLNELGVAYAATRRN